MKDELSGRIMSEFAGLRSKMYAFRVEGEDYCKKVKGIRTAAVKKSITFDHYKETVFNKTEKYIFQHTITSQLHCVKTLKQCKKALSFYDDKRKLCQDNITTRAWGHHENTS